MKHLILTTSLAALGLGAGSAQAHFIGVGGNNSIDGSLCVGNDCVAEEGFGFDTIRLKENNLRVHFNDTSTSASFPGNDWRIRINDSTNGGGNYFAVEDANNGNTPFRVNAGARNNALYLDNQGDLGLGTNNPVVSIHARMGNTPTLRLEQDGSSGFSPQIWDVAGNEANFFIRDASNGSTLPFRIRTGALSSAIEIEADEVVINDDHRLIDFRVESDTGENALFVDAATGNIGLGTNSPSAPLEISKSGTFVFFRMTAEDATNPNADVTYTAAGGAGEIRYNIVETGVPGDNHEMSLDADGNLTIDGELTTSGSCSIGCDRVFTAEYDLPSITEHHAAMWEQGYLPNVGPTVEGQPFNVTDKLGRVLNELEHAHIFISRQQDEIETLKANQAKQMAALVALQEALAAQ